MNTNLFDLTGKNGIVTGAARGLGRAAAVGLAAHGANVAAIDLDSERCAETIREIEAMGRRATVYGCNVADEGAVRRTVEQIHHDFGQIDILVNIAGITARIPTTEIEPDVVRRLTEVNYYGTFWMCKEVGRTMLAQGGGVIVNMSALGGGFLGTGRGNAAYSSTKEAIASLTKELACEWGDKGIRFRGVGVDPKYAKPCRFEFAAHRSA
jgi:NAD(P)-dependent dehydrogenase (short-subunit alcohol dehydrogenase family)